MFGQPGHAYVYFIYGCHFCVNAVCRPPGIGEAVLIRAIEPAFGEPLLQEHRGKAHHPNLSNGPGKLCQAMKIDRCLDGVDLCNPNSELFIAENPQAADFKKKRSPLIVSPRIGISQAISEPLRFFLSGSSFVSSRWNGKLQPRRRRPVKSS
jgi:DNA-3-methyladenine glycosylase